MYVVLDILDILDYTSASLVLVLVYYCIIILVLPGRSNILIYLSYRRGHCDILFTRTGILLGLNVKLDSAM